MIADFDGDAMDARFAGEFFCMGATQYDGDDEYDEDFSPESPVPLGVSIPESEAAHALDTLLAKYGMKDMYSSATLRMWANTERTFPRSFPFKALFFLMPDTFTNEERAHILDAGQVYLNNCPRRARKNKTPLEQIETADPKNRTFETDVYTYDEYRPQYEQASILMAKSDFEGAYTAYEALIQQMLDEKVPVFLAFRLYANAALACFMNSDDRIYAVGVALVRASLRLNPQYDFGITQREKYVDPYEDMSAVPKKDKEIAKIMHDAIEEDALRKYNQSAFAKYEKFLQKCGVSLSFATTSKITIYKISP
jgi:hypothetical protein